MGLVMILRKWWVWEGAMVVVCCGGGKQQTAIVMWVVTVIGVVFGVLGFDPWERDKTIETHIGD